MDLLKNKFKQSALVNTIIFLIITFYFYKEYFPSKSTYLFYMLALVAISSLINFFIIKNSKIYKAIYAQNPTEEDINQALTMLKKHRIRNTRIYFILVIAYVIITGYTGAFNTFIISIVLILFIIVNGLGKNISKLILYNK